MRSDSSTCSSPTTFQPPTRRNVLIVGDVGVGKSSLINLIAGEELAKTSHNARSCTLQSQEHLVAFDGIEFVLHDTAGMHEARDHMKKTDYLDAIHQAYALISKLERSGGISLLVFCMKAGRISVTTQQTYNLFVEVLCNRQVPVVVAVTHLEEYDYMEQWWTVNEGAIKEYGLRSLGHACITSTRGYKNIFADKYEESRAVVRKLLLEYSGRIAWKEEKSSWVKRMMLHMRSWLSARRAKEFDGSNLRRKLVKRCGFSTEDADCVAQRIEQSRSSEDDPGEETMWFDEKFRSDSTSSCVSLPVVPYTT